MDFARSRALVAVFASGLFCLAWAASRFTRSESDGLNAWLTASWQTPDVRWEDAIPKSAGAFLPLACEPAFGSLKFWDPLYVTQLPDGSGRMVVVERRGTIQLLSRQGSSWTKTLFADLQDRVVLTPDQAEQGLLGLAFHPKFGVADSPHSNDLFMFYVGRTEASTTNRLSRFRTIPGRLDRVDLTTEEVLIDQPDIRQSHNAGCTIFGPDGMLYVAVGDDDPGETNPHAQRIDRDLFSGILRLDVDCQGGEVSHAPPRQPNTGKTAGYMIPNDNPFVGRPGVLEEFYALGLRNPWRMSFDSVTNRLYVSDPGDRRREEINCVDAGSNCQWDLKEGSLERSHHGDGSEPHDAEPLGVPTPPLFEYTRDAARRCVIGGYVYRGSKFPELVGKFVYADQSQRIYALDLEDDGRWAGANHWLAAINEIGVGISSLGEDAEGELYVATIRELATETGCIYRLRRPAVHELNELPPTLAATGLFADWQTLKPAKGLVPFEVRVPFWSDGAQKRRWIALRPGAEVTLASRDKLQFPPGTVFVKHFDIAMDERTPDVRRRLETRVLVCDESGETFGATYRWSVDGRRADIVNQNQTEDLSIIELSGVSTTQTWQYPGRFECNMCHNSASEGVLGYTLRQLDCDVPCENGAREPQIPRLVSANALPIGSTNVAAKLTEPKLAAADDRRASIEDRVRSYLDVNCSMCHNPNRRFAAFDARIVRPLAEQGLIDGASYYHRELGTEVRIISPGDVDRSMLHLRVTSQDLDIRMPPVGSLTIDPKAVSLFSEYILSLAPSTPNVEEPVAATATTQTSPQEAPR